MADLYSTYDRINSLSPRMLLKIVLYSYMKESDDKSAEKSAESAENSADLKNREGMALSEKHEQILAIMEAGIEYSTEQVAEKIGLKGPRTRQLLNELVNKELLACIGTTKRRRYIKPVN